MLLYIFTTHIKYAYEGVRYDCNHCDYIATRQGNLTTHTKSVHKGDKYECDQCVFSATHRGNLTRHIESAHKGLLLKATRL